MKVLKKHRTKIKFIAYAVFLMMSGLIGRMTYVVVFRGEELTVKATELHERERAIKAGRGRIISSDGTVLATNETVCTVSVIHSQIKDPERVISILSEELDMDEEKVRKYVEKFSSMEKIKSNVPKETGDAIRSYELAGVKVDEDSKRIYPYSELASKILGFTGADNQGILGLEIEYDDVLKGTNGQILTLTDASGVEIEEKEVKRVEPVAGDDLYISIDYNIQSYATQLARTAYYSNQAKSVSIIVMNPDNGEMLAMVNYPEYNLNDPFTDGTMEEMNRIWRNTIINDTYEPGSTFKVITATAALDSGSVTLNNHYSCSGRIHVADRFVRCANARGHGAQTFAQSLQNSCNPAFITWGLMTGKDNMVKYMESLGLYSNISVLEYEESGTIIKQSTTETMRGLLKNVVELGGGLNCRIEGYSIAGKTATSEKLPRGNGKYIASFIGIAPAENPQVIAMCIIDEPVGMHYGGVIAAPVVKSLFENILPYLGIEKGQM